MPGLGLDVEEVHPSRVRPVDTDNPTGEETGGEAGDERDPLGVVVALRPLLPQLGDLTAGEPLVSSGPGDLAEPGRASHRLLQLPALLAGRTVHPDRAVQD